MEKIDWHVIALESTLSTNSYLDALDTAGPRREGTVVVAREQLAGRGQRGNSWEAAPGENLTYSYLLRPHMIAPHEQFVLSQAVSLAVTDVLSRYAGGFTVKWPNDIYHNDNKIAGILIEHNLAGGAIVRTIVGIGLNVNQQSFVSDAPNPVSLCHVTGRYHPLDALLHELLDATACRYDMCRNRRDVLHADYMDNLYRRDGVYPYRDSNGVFRARIEAVLPGGTLVLVDTAGKRREYAFKEVSFIL